MKRVMCVHLPLWPVQNLHRLRPELRDKPLVFTEHQPSGARVTLCCPRATRAGIRPGMALAEAVAIHRQLVVREEVPAQDRRALERLAEWAQRYSPIVSLEDERRPQSLLLDISGCAACFHGEDRLAGLAARELRGQGWSARLAIAGTLGAAWAVAHTLDASSPCLVPPADTEKTLAPLPLGALRLPPEIVATLASLGIEHIAQLIALPRADISGRFGPLVLQRLDQALGHRAEPIVPHQPLPEVQAACSFEYPTDRLDVLHHALDELLERIEAALRQRNRGATRLECRLHHEALPPTRLEVGLFRPSGSARHLGRLLRGRLERVHLAGPVARLSLRVPGVEMMAQRQFELFDADSSRLEELGDLIDRLANQFGREAVTFARLVDDCQPEYACRFEPAIAQPGKRRPAAEPAATTILDGQRPVLMWPVPLAIEVLSVFPAGAPCRFVWLGKEYTVRHAWGPERIETGWWRGHDVHRDYYMVETHLGTRLWLFRRHEDKRWFLHGCFD